MLAAAVVGTGVAIEAQKPATPPAQPAAAKPADAAKPAGSFERYRSPQEANAALLAINKANPSQTALHTIATSPGGVDLSVLEIGPDVGQEGPQDAGGLRRRPTWRACCRSSTEAALSLADRLLASGSATKNLTWFILPNGNPDAAARYFRKPLVADERNASRWNDDMDDQTDEDGPDDLDGNGVITEMRVKDPAGEWIPVDGEPRLMRKADPRRARRGSTSSTSRGSTTTATASTTRTRRAARTSASRSRTCSTPGPPTGGRWPGSEPETFGIMKFAIDHPEIAMTFAFGVHQHVPAAAGRRPPGQLRRQRDQDPRARWRRAWAPTPNRTYTMKEIIEMVRPLAPPGFEITEGIIASFLGLGAVVNPLDEDLKFYKELSEKYKEFLKTNKLDAKRLEPPQPKDGSFELWSYYHLGVPVFTMDLWTLPEVKAEEKEKSGITPESLEAMTPDAFVALGEAKIAAFLKEVGAPDNIKPAMLLEGVKSGKMTPKQMAGMLKQMPKPKDAAAADPKQKALLAFSDKELQGKGYVNWTPFKHPTLGDVEIGGIVPFTDTTPPASMVKALLDGQVPWVISLAEKLPQLKVLKTEAQGEGRGRLRGHAVGREHRLPAVPDGDGPEEPARAAGHRLIAGGRRT